MMVMLLLAAAALLALVTYGLAAFFLARAFTHCERQRVRGTPAADGMRFDEVQFRADDDTVLRGWFIESPGARAVVVVVHDASGTRSTPERGLLDLDCAYVRSGYHVLAFDLRGCGESTGRRSGFGDGESRDLAAAVDYARARAGGLPLVLHGFGFGGALAIGAAARGLEADAVIADSAFASAREQLRRRWGRVPGHLFSAACLTARVLYGADASALSPIRVIDAATAPILLVHSEDDDEVPAGDAANLMAACLSGRNELWLLPDGGHCGAYLRDPAGYLRRCLAFIERAVPVRLTAATAG